MFIGGKAAKLQILMISMPSRAIPRKTSKENTRDDFPSSGEAMPVTREPGVTPEEPGEVEVIKKRF
ncbi:MAG: hypothetical protein WDO71_26945 [Bacteroidota bacterium]